MVVVVVLVHIRGVDYKRKYKRGPQLKLHIRGGESDGGEYEGPRPMMMLVVNPQKNWR